MYSNRSIPRTSQSLDQAYHIRMGQETGQRRVEIHFIVRPSSLPFSCCPTVNRIGVRESYVPSNTTRAEIAQGTVRVVLPVISVSLKSRYRKEKVNAESAP